MSSASPGAIPANRPRTRRSWSLQAQSVTSGGMTFAGLRPPFGLFFRTSCLASLGRVVRLAPCHPRPTATDQTELVPPRQRATSGGMTSVSSASGGFSRANRRGPDGAGPSRARRHFWRDDLRVVRLAPCHPRRPPRTRRSWSLQGQEMLAVFNYRNRRIFG